MDARRRAAACILALLWAGPAAADPQSGTGAQEPLVTDRPDFTESAETVPRGRIQVEGGYTHTRAGAAAAHALGEVLVRVGLAPGIELRLGLNSYVWAAGPGGSASGREDASIGVKLKLLDGGRSGALGGATVAAVLGTTLPTGDDEVGGGGLGPQAVLAAAWELGERLSLASNLSYRRAQGGDGGVDWLAASVSLGASLTSRAGAYIEYYTLSPELAGALHFLDGGATCLLTDDFQLDARVGVGLGGRGGVFAGAGAAWRF